MNKRIDTLAMAKEIQDRYPHYILNHKRDKLVFNYIKVECITRGIVFENGGFPPNKYVSYPPNNGYYLSPNKMCFCKNKRTYTEVCFHFTTRPCDEGVTYVYCWHEDGTIKKHRIGNCPHSTYTIEED